MNPENSFPACRVVETNEARVWEYLRETRQVLGRFDFDQSEFPNLRVVAREILESAREN